MKTSTRKMMVMAAAVFMVSCASTGSQPAMDAEAPQDTGFLKGYYQYLQPGPEGGAKMRWIKPGVDFGKYNKIMIDSVVFYFADDSESKAIAAEDMSTLAKGCNLAVINALKASYPIVSEPGPDVLRIRFAITDLKKSDPVMSAVTSVVPIGLGVSLVKKGASGSFVGSGATSAEFMALDSMTNEVIGAAQDDKSAGFTERFSDWGSAEDAFTFWANRIVLFLEKARGM